MYRKIGITVVILIVLLMASLSYIGYTEYSRRNDQKQISAFQQGAQAGYEQAVVQVAQQAATCQQVPLRVENQTINVVAVECLAE